MNTFQEVPANKNSLANRKPIYGVGINDADYVVNQIINGKRVMCPYYAKWSSMITRCYSPKYHEKRPTYIDCSVTKEWLTFTNFRVWMEKQDWQGKDLDKDILFHGNKVYSAMACVFVSSEINKLLNSNDSARGEYKLGVYFKKENNKFLARCSDGAGKRIHLDYYKNEDEAHEAYKKYKYKLISDIASQQTEPLKSAMLNHVILEY